MKRSTVLIITVALLAIGNTSAAVCHTVPEASTPKIYRPGGEASIEIGALLDYFMEHGNVPDSIPKELKDLLKTLAIAEKLIESEKGLEDASLVPTAVSESPLLTPDCLFKVCMGDPIKPDGGWGTDVIDLEIRKYEGSLPFQKIYIKGTRQGGACSVHAAGTHTNPIPSSLKLRLLNLLIRYYGRPKDGFGPFPNNPTPPPLLSAAWIDLRTLYDVRHIRLLFTSRSASISYLFANGDECSKPLQGADAPTRTP